MWEEIALIAGGWGLGVISYWLAGAFAKQKERYQERAVPEPERPKKKRLAV